MVKIIIVKRNFLLTPINQGIPEDLTHTTEDAAKVRQKVLNRIHRARIAALALCVKFP